MIRILEYSLAAAVLIPALWFGLNFLLFKADGTAQRKLGEFGFLNEKGPPLVKEKRAESREAIKRGR